MDFSHINFLAVIVAGVAAWALGALWYSPVLFSKIWQREIGHSDEELKNANFALIFGTSAVMMVVMALGMAILMFGHGLGSHMDGTNGLLFGLGAGIFFVAPSIAINYLYQRQSLTLYAIDAVYQILFMGVIGLILGVWH
jgi:hypothetical protein